jgi:hypothetical protein
LSTNEKKEPPLCLLLKRRRDGNWKIPQWITLWGSIGMTIQKAVILNSSSEHSLMKNLQLPFFVASSYEGKTKNKGDSSSPKSEIENCKSMVKGL